ncbi:hypothetical protein KIW84_072848 [Lathyrus oleraceus]|uniref:B-like cyclin n=1 Tax=Pisum sativum TaxID=3888 RepID=A0A9D4VMX5_PEA|nr:hypothetical protein KIW84_072848 [Pisum sativum]
MFTRSRRFPSSSSSSKNSDDSISNKKVINVVKTQLTKKHPALAKVTNNTNASLVKTIIGAPLKHMVSCVSKTAKTKTDSIASSKKNVMSKNTLQPPIKSQISNDGAVCPDIKSVVCAPRWMDISPSNTFSGSVSLDESLSTRRIQDIDTILKSIANEIVDIDCNFKDPRFCASIANEIYENLRVSEKIKRPSIDFMEKIQTNINVGMQAMLIDWLVEVAEEYKLLPDTLFLAVNYLDRYLSGKRINTNLMSNPGQNEIQVDD